MKKIITEEFKENNRRMVRVSLGNDKFAVVEAADWNELRNLGVGSWRIGANGHVITSVNAANNGYCLVSRLILDCKEHETVAYRDGNTLNLRRSNVFKRWDPRKNLTNSRELVALSSLPSAKRMEAVLGH